VKCGARAAALCLTLMAASVLPARAQENALERDIMARLTSARWSMILPAKDFEGGCVVGFLAWSFSPTGYFIYNNRIKGSWRLDELGNLKLRTRDGVRFTLIIEDNILRPTANLGFLQRFQRFQRCTGTE
jgi:hypothetical protein